MINRTSSAIPRVNQPSIDRRNELDEQWKKLKVSAEAITEKIKQINSELWSAGIGAIKYK